MRIPCRLTDAPFDLLVIGAGIHGACVARDAALRGMSVALVDRGDFGAATSHNSLKIVHGGIRYLQQFDFDRVRASVRERNIWLRTAPHLVRPLEFVLATSGWGLRGRPAVAGAFALYNLLARDRDNGLPAEQRIPAARTVGRAEARRRFDGEPVEGAAIWSDGQILDADRVLLECIQDAVAAGAVAANYCAVDALTHEAGAVRGARVTDLESGDAFEVRARLTVNATGPWVDELLQTKGARVDGAARMEHVWALNLVLPGVGLGSALGVAGAENRVYFATPWCGRTILGTWQGPSTGADEVGEEQIEAFLAEIRARFPRIPARRSDVLYTHAGLMPLERRMADGSFRLARHSTLLDHGTVDGVDGILSVRSVKWTTARLVAEQAVDWVAARLDGTWSECATHTRPLPGAVAGETRDDRLESAASRACRDEWVVHLHDLVERRLHARFAGWPAQADLDRCATVAARELGWDDARTRAERARVEARIAADLRE